MLRDDFGRDDWLEADTTPVVDETPAAPPSRFVRGKQAIRENYRKGKQVLGQGFAKTETAIGKAYKKSENAIGSAYKKTGNAIARCREVGGRCHKVQTGFSNRFRSWRGGYPKNNIGSFPAITMDEGLP